MSGSLSTKTLTDRFATPARPKQGRKKRSPPVSIRFSTEEHTLLKQRAGEESLSAYIRQRALNGELAPSKIRGQTPIIDHKALARVLSALGRSELHKSLSSVIALIENDTLAYDKNVADSLRKACSDVAVMRRDLITALGLRSEVQ